LGNGNRWELEERRRSEGEREGEEGRKENIACM